MNGELRSAHTRFSVITPSSRQLPWLDLAAASVADQMVAVEHLVQDGGSPGIEAWAQRHPAVGVRSEKDEGMYDAINRGLRRATGSICSYLNCDEQYLPGTLRHVGDYFDAHPWVDVVFGDAIVTDSLLNPLALRRVVLPGRWHTLLRPLGVLTCSTFFRRRLVDEGALFDPSWKIIGDKAWILRLINRGYRMAVLPEPLAIFAMTGDNLSRRPDCDEERQRWERGHSPALRLVAPWVRGRHLLQKWQRGAYKKTPLDSAWYTFDSLTHRRPFTALTLDWKWPSLA